MAPLNRDLLFGGLRAIAKKLRRRQSSSSSSSSKKRQRSPSSSTPRPYVDHSASTSSSSSPCSSTGSSSSHRNDIRRVFAEYDADGDGRISLHDLTRVVTAVAGASGVLSASDAAAEAAAMMEVADLDRDGYIGFDEFQALMTTAATTTTLNPAPREGPPNGDPSVQLDDDAGNDDGTHPQQQQPCSSTCTPCDPEQGWAWAGDEEDIRLAFAIYDHDGDGVITGQEIHAVLRRVMENTAITLADCRRMVQAVDRDGDGVVGFHDFAAMIWLRRDPRVHPCANCNCD